MACPWTTAMMTCWYGKPKHLLAYVLVILFSQVLRETLAVPKSRPRPDRRAARLLLKTRVRRLSSATNKRVPHMAP
ncbi:hypothetical protein F5B21DRAFT_493670 [Xylaria acuta]|nr:hypothetical protein F5B21DRAFT_493670 [Xylaria acuta]